MDISVWLSTIRIPHFPLLFIATLRLLEYSSQVLQQAVVFLIVAKVGVLTWFLARLAAAKR
jgi:hypothetical protein